MNRYFCTFKFIGTEGVGRYTKEVTGMISIATDMPRLDLDEIIKRCVEKYPELYDAKLFLIYVYREQIENSTLKEVG